jgi:hypothetical protein
MSPNPTVVKLAILNHMASKKLEKKVEWIFYKSKIKHKPIIEKN